MKIELMQGDCLEMMKGIPDKSVDMILCDLPYGVTGCKWDNQIPLEPLWEQYKRIIKDYKAIALFGVEPFSSYLRMSNIKQYKYDWVWIKNRFTNQLNAKIRPMQAHELISVFSIGYNENGIPQNRMVYYPQNLKNCSIIRSGNIRRWSMGYFKGQYVQTNTNYPTTILKFNCDTDYLHNTQKPVALLEYLIMTYTRVGETVLDNTMGSVSTGVACKKCNRNFIGIELFFRFCG